MTDSNMEFTGKEFLRCLLWYAEIESKSGADKKLPLDSSQLAFFDFIDSTNVELKRRLDKAGALRNQDGTLTEEGKKYHHFLAAASKQSAGKGRLGRPFFSPAETGIYFSYVYVPEGGVKDPAIYTAATVVGVCRAVKKLYGIESQIKWVNDVYVNGKKASGILAEGIMNPETGTIPAVIVGTGINLVLNKDLPEELKSRVGGIFSKKADFDSWQEKQNVRCQLLAGCMYEILKILDSGEDFFTEYRKRSMLPGKTVTVSPVIGNEKNKFLAKVLDVTDDAGLLVEKDDGSKTVLYSGEVTLHQE